MNNKQSIVESYNLGSKLPVKVQNLAPGGKSFKFKIDRNDSEIERGISYYQKKPEQKNILISKPILLDFINIGVATFIADKGIERSINSKRYNVREIEITIPVIKKEKWIENKNILEKLVGFLTYDSIFYDFKDYDNIKKFYKDERFSIDSDCVSLLSGGLDSFGGSQYLIQNNHNPIFVSIEQGSMENLLNNVYSSMESKYRNNKFIFKLLPNIKNIKGISNLESTQFSRSFMYLSFATAVANEFNIQKVYIPETGIIATQIGLKDSRFVTRTVNPKFLFLYNKLINNLFIDWKLKLINPFSYLTKKEIINNYLLEKEKNVYETISCSKKRHSIENFHNCGICIQCLIRNISLRASELNYEGQNEIYD